MSKRCRVRCNCSDRKLLIGSDSLFACGHPDGNQIDYFGGRLLIIGLDVIDVFREESQRFAFFKRLTEWCVANEGSLFISPSEAEDWLEEIQELKAYDEGKIEFSKEQKEGWKELREGEILRYAETDEDPPSVYERLIEAEALCKASIRTGNPIEFY